jgi:hypothetical protein
MQVRIISGARARWRVRVPRSEYGATAALQSMARKATPATWEVVMASLSRPGQPAGLRFQSAAYVPAVYSRRLSVHLSR